MAETLVPARHQAALPLDRLIVSEAPSSEAVEMDVVFVGAGPAGLAGAIELARLVKKDGEGGGGLGEVNIAVLEKADGLGQHNLSGAVVNPSGFRALFPELKDADFPFRAARGRRAGLLPDERRRLAHPHAAAHEEPRQLHGQPVRDGPLARREGRGARRQRVHGHPGRLAAGPGRARSSACARRPPASSATGRPAAASPRRPTSRRRWSSLSDGTRSPLAQAWAQWAGVPSQNPQIYALGVKEVWEVKQPLDAVIHTMGWPLPRGTFGGSWFYPLGKNLVSIGLVAGLDARRSDLDVHRLLQTMKLHPLFRTVLEGGTLVEWGAKTIPEGGFYALPERRQGRGVMLLGDAAGFVDVAGLKGIHHAMHSGIAAAQAIFRAMKAKDTGPDALAPYDEAMAQSDTMKLLRKRRNMRLAFKSGFVLGGHQGVAHDRDVRHVPRLAHRLRERRRGGPRGGPARRRSRPTASSPSARWTASSARATRPATTCRATCSSARTSRATVADLYASLCPAGVYERQGDKLVVNAPNCIDCKATDVLGPRWTPREGGSGPRYTQM